MSDIEDYERLRDREKTLELNLEIARERLDKATAELEQIKGILVNPTAVHINLLRGTIAYTPEGLRHVLGMPRAWDSDRPLWEPVYTTPKDNPMSEALLYQRLCAAAFDVSFTIFDGVGTLSIPHHEVARLRELQETNPTYWCINPDDWEVFSDEHETREEALAFATELADEPWRVVDRVNDKGVTVWDVERNQKDR